MQTSGLILDVYDDYRGEVLRSIYSSRQELPGTVKTAHQLSSTERDLLPDDSFALVLELEDGSRLRKFACTDPGNTELSVAYFQKVAHRLPVEVQERVASNLAVACSWYELNELAKEAGLLGWAGKQALKNPLGTAVTAVTAPAQIAGVKSGIKSNMAGVRAAESFSPGAVAIPGHAKLGEATGSRLMPQQAPLNKPPIRKVAASKDVDPAIPGLADDTGVPGAQKDAPQMRKMSPRVQVSGAALPTPMIIDQQQKTTKEAYALGQKYPLNSYTQVKTAAAYFEEHAGSFTPWERREFATNLVKRASQLALPVGPQAQDYAQRGGWADPDAIKLAQQTRAEYLGETTRKDLEELFAKQAELDPEVFCHAVSLFDQATQLSNFYGHGVKDPYLGLLQKEASGWSFMDGELYLNEDSLQRLIKTRHEVLAKRYGAGFLKELSESPTEIFDTLPLDQKRSLASMVPSTSVGG